MREMFEDWFAAHPAASQCDTDKKELLFAAFEEGAKAGDNSSVPAKKLKEEIKHLNAKITELEGALNQANTQLAEYSGASDTQSNG